MKMKNKMLALLTLACACTLTTGVVVAGAQENAGEPATQNTSVFKVLDGASIKLSDIDESYGIKFIAEVGETDVNATYNFMIAPAYLVDVYESDDAQDKANLVDYIKAYAESKGGEVAIVENCPVGEVQVNETTTVNGIYGAIVDLYWLNLNRDFVGIAYTTNAQGAVTRVADLADDGARSIADVAKNTTGAEFEEVTAEIALNAEKSADGVVADSETNENLVAKTTLFARTETIVNGIDDTYGAYWGFQYPSEEGNTEWKIDTATLAQRLVGYEKVSFSIYNPYGGERPIHINTGSDWSGTKLYDNVLIAAESWQEFSISVSDLTSVYVVMGGTNVADKTVKFSQFKAYTKVEIEAQLKAQAAEVVALINALPAVEELTLLDGVKIQKASEALNALPAEAQALVTNVDKLQAVTTAWNAKFTVIHDMKTQTGITKNGNYITTATLSNGYDETYGNYLQVNYTKGSQCYLTYSITDLETKLEGYDTVYFYVYNGATTTKSVIANFGGSTNTNYANLKAEDWTLVGAPVEDFVSASGFGVEGSADGTSTTTHKIGAIIAAKETASDDLQLAKQNKTGWAVGSGVAKMAFGYGYDATYGYNVAIARVYQAADNGKNLLATYDFASFESALEGYDTVYFYVYNPFAEDKQFYSDFGGTASAGVTLKMGEWTRVEVSATDFVKGTYLGLKAGSASFPQYTYFRVSSFMATKA